MSKVTSDDLIEVWRNKHNSEADELFCYFYAKELTEPVYCQMERNALEAIEWGKECFGVIRAPVFDLGHRNESYEALYGKKGFSWYLSHSFVAMARSQLINTLVKVDVLTQDEADLLREIIDTKHDKLRNEFCNK